MSAPIRRFFSADTETQAVMDAAEHFGVTPAELAYRAVEKKHGFLRRPRAVIEVDPASPRRLAAPAPPEPPAVPVHAGGPTAARRLPEPGGPHPPAAPSQRESPHRASGGPHPAGDEQRLLPVGLDPYEGALSGRDGAVAAAAAVAALAGFRVTASGEVVTGEEGEEVRVELAGPGREALLARAGELLLACEHLVRRMVRDLPAGGLTLDSGGYREERTRTLRRRAQAAAEEVRRSGEAVVFEPLPAAERRILHLAIETESGVASESEGEGDRRSVRVFARDERTVTPR